MRRTRNIFSKPIFLIIAFSMIPISHLGLIWHLHNSFDNKLKQGETRVKIEELHHRGENYVELWAFYGDIFYPKKNNPDIEVDLVPVPCIIDPLTLINGNLIWEQNNLLNSALSHTYPDKQAFTKAIDELVLSMSSNSELVSYFLNLSTSEYIFDPEKLREITKIYIWELPKSGDYYKTSKIEYMSSLPIFNPNTGSKTFSELVLHQRLEDNIFLTLTRLMNELDNSGYSNVYTLAIPAIAGSSHRIDSSNYLTYKQSFLTIYDSLTKSKIPNRIDRIYLVVYDDLPTLDEEEDAINGLFYVYLLGNLKKYSSFSLPESNSFILALPYILIFTIVFLLSHPNIKNSTNTPKGRRGTALEIIGFFVLFTSMIPLINNLLEIRSENSVFLFIGSEFLLSFLSGMLVFWINKRRKPVPEFSRSK